MKTNTYLFETSKEALQPARLYSVIRISAIPQVLALFKQSTKTIIGLQLIVWIC